MDCSPPRSSVHGTFQARTLEWVAISFQGIFLTRDQTHVSCLAGRFFQVLYPESPGKPPGFTHLAYPCSHCLCRWTVGRSSAFEKQMPHTLIHSWWAGGALSYLPMKVFPVFQIVIAWITGTISYSMFFFFFFFLMIGNRILLLKLKSILQFSEIWLSNIFSVILYIYIYF